MDKPLWLWIIFALGILSLIYFDLKIAHKNDTKNSLKKTLYLSILYFVIAIAYGIFIYFYYGKTQGIDYITAYLVEKSLAFDNIFAISMIFSYFKIPDQFRHKVLFIGILSAIILRGIAIYLGAEILQQFQGILYIFALILIFAGIKMLFVKLQKSESQQKFVSGKTFLQKWIRTTSQIKGEKFWIKEKGKWVATPLFSALFAIECTDLIFAIDSIPAVLAITQDIYIVYTSNIFAILGLRSLYFVLDHALYKFDYLKYALSIVLIFIGGKIFYSALGGKISSLTSLTIISLLISSGIIASLMVKKDT